MRWLLFLSRVAFICNLFFLLTVLLQWRNLIGDERVASTVVIIGYLLAVFLFNPVVNLSYGFTLLRKKPLFTFVPRWLVLGAVSVRLFSFTPGQYALGLMVVSVDNRMHVGIGRALGRGLLLTLVIPALFMDSDMRGMQDKFTFTAVVRR